MPSNHNLLCFFLTNLKTTYCLCGILSVSITDEKEPLLLPTNSFSVGLLKGGKPQRKNLNISLYGMESGKFELTYYIN